MHVERYADASSFLVAAQSFLLENEAENGMLAVAQRLARGQGTEGDRYFTVVRDGEQVQGAALLGRPGLVMITQLRGGAAAIAMLAENLCVEQRRLDELVGPEPSCGALALEVAARSGRKAHRRMHTRVHALSLVELPDPLAPGSLRVAEAADLPLLTGWVAAFCAAIGDSAEDAPALARDRIEAGTLFIWEDGEPVAMAAKARPTPNGIAINLVYTPPQLRGRGYASACVGKLTERLLAEGKRFVCLYTDVTNRTSNAIYYRLGYRPVSDAGNYTFE